MSDFVKIVEVGPRDGLQNEKIILPLSVKKELIERLNQTGVSVIEVGACVSPKWVPQMANSVELFKTIKKKNTISYPMLVPNLRGMEDAMNAGVKEIAIFAAASEGFSQKNINCSIAESFDRFTDAVKVALDNDIKVRGYVSCVIACPYDGKTDPRQVSEVTKRLFDLSVYEVSLGDTIGAGEPDTAKACLDHVLKNNDTNKIAWHAHDTNGRALDVIETAYDMGVRVFDASIAGLGGCPYAGGGASGNVATEKVLEFFDQKHSPTHIDLNLYKEHAQWISAILTKIKSEAI